MSRCAVAVALLAVAPAARIAGRVLFRERVTLRALARPSLVPMELRVLGGCDEDEVVETVVCLIAVAVMDLEAVEVASGFPKDDAVLERVAVWASLGVTGTPEVYVPVSSDSPLGSVVRARVSAGHQRSLQARDVDGHSRQELPSRR